MTLKKFYLENTSEQEYYYKFYGLVAGFDFLPVAEYGKNYTNPEI